MHKIDSHFLRILYNKRNSQNYVKQFVQLILIQFRSKSLSIIHLRNNDFNILIIF